MLEVLVRDVLDVVPLNFDVAYPFVSLAPIDNLGINVRAGRQHLSHSAELSTLVKTEEEINRITPILLRVLVNLGESLIAFFGARPDFMGKSLSEIINSKIYLKNIFFIETFDYKKSGSFFKLKISLIRVH